MSMRSMWLPAILGVAALTTAAGLLALINFDTAPGVGAHPKPMWPKNSKLARARGRKQIVLIAHPQCSCTAATLEELSQISGAEISALFFRPGPESNWQKGVAWDQINHIKGAAALWDDGGTEARLFGASTSGSVLLYGLDGGLLFHGGITASRGHAGANHGLAQLELAIRTGLPSPGSTPVFGCSLLNAGARS